MGDCNSGEAGMVEVTRRNKKATEIAEMKEIPMPMVLPEDKQNVICVWTGKLELKGKLIVYQLDRG